SRSPPGPAPPPGGPPRWAPPPPRGGGPGGGAGGAPPPPTDESLAPLLEWATAHLDGRLTLDRLAERAGLSSRTLARRFAEQLGTSPGQWLLGRRIDAARVLLEQTDLPVETVATRVGLASAVNLRRRFRTAVGTTPGAYRQIFGGAQPEGGAGGGGEEGSSSIPERAIR
ncbi:helix-turn-helix domain-containing protein, partial [Streptomyces avermitilis]|uniref:helix-turn-helix domain-containing protein n=1 Tax=Streptomyces avermitilis TaxID=33903 RepID=UPI003F4C0C42